MIKYYLFLGLTHILGDFYFQTEKLAVEKEKKSKYVLIRKRVVKNGWNTFWMDQAAHLVSIVIVAIFLDKYNFIINTGFLSIVANYVSVDLDKTLRWALITSVLI